MSRESRARAPANTTVLLGACAANAHQWKSVEHSQTFLEMNTQVQLQWDARAHKNPFGKAQRSVEMGMPHYPRHNSISSVCEISKWQLGCKSSAERV